MAKKIKTIRTIDINNVDIFPLERTSFGLLEKEEGRKDRVIKYIQEWKTKLGDKVKSAIEKIEELETTKTKLKKIEENNPKLGDLKSYFNVFNKEDDIVDEAKGYGVRTLASLKKKGDDNDIVKLLKEVMEEEDQAIAQEIQIKDWPAGVAGIIFMTETVEKFYLAYLPKWLEEKLNVAEPVKLEEIQEPLKKILDDEKDGIFTTLYLGFASTDERKDLDDFQQKINNGLTEIETLIDEKRKTKKPQENIEDIKKQLEETKARLKIYDDAFGYLYPLDQFPNGTQMISDWWDGLNTEWKKSFKDKYGIIYSENLKKLKKDLDDKEQEISNWIKTFPNTDFPKGAESVKELIDKLKTSQGGSTQDKETVEILTNWCSDLINLVHKYDKNPKLLETPPTPPNSPEITKPIEDNTEIPPIKTKIQS